VARLDTPVVDVVGGTTAKVAEPFSMRAEEKRQEARGKKKPKPSRLVSAAATLKKEFLTMTLVSTSCIQEK